MRSYFPDTDIGKSRTYTGFFQRSRPRIDTTVPAYIFVKALRGTIASNKEIQFLPVDYYYKDECLWFPCVLSDTKEGRKWLRHNAVNHAKLSERALK